MSSSWGRKSTDGYLLACMSSSSSSSRASFAALAESAMAWSSSVGGAVPADLDPVLSGSDGACTLVDDLSEVDSVDVTAVMLVLAHTGADVDDAFVTVGFGAEVGILFVGV